jgi:hypothetical protein
VNVRVRHFGVERDDPTLLSFSIFKEFFQLFVQTFHPASSQVLWTVHKHQEQEIMCLIGTYDQFMPELILVSALRIF